MENRLLAKIPGEELEALRPHFERVSLHHGEHAIIPDEPIRHAYFPVNCLLSLVTQMADGAMAESGSIGREGMSGVPILLGARQTPMPTFTQIPGEAIRIRADILREAYERSRPLREWLNRYIHTVVVVGSQATACNALHKIEARMCKWLLMSSDGVGSQELRLTHEYLAAMLGVRRASVTETAIKLKDAGLINYERGFVTILDRERLTSMACECYGRTKAEYERLFSE
ncbi:MAG: Crp/Fnr family transcriptional regulator [Pyrinomonadaceae bacterium]